MEQQFHDNLKITNTMEYNPKNLVCSMFHVPCSMKKGFTLVEMLVVIAIIAILATIALYSATQYINKGRDATIKGNLVVLVTAGELWYDRNSSKYITFCGSSAVTKAFDETPTDETDEHCYAVDNAWAVCAKLFVYPDKAYCVDNKGNQREINNDDCVANITICPESDPEPIP